MISIFKHRHRPEPWKGLVSGLPAGLIGTIAMTQFQTAWSSLSAKLSENGNQQRDPENQFESGEQQSESATVKAASTLSRRLLDHELTREEKQQAGNAVHYGFGITVGACYGLLAEFKPAAARGAGLPFGAGLFVAADEIAVPALGFSGKPAEMPLSTHAYGLAAHLIYGASAELVRRAVRRALG